MLLSSIMGTSRGPAIRAWIMKKLFMNLIGERARTAAQVHTGQLGANRQLITMLITL